MQRWKVQEQVTYSWIVDAKDADSAFSIVDNMSPQEKRLSSEVESEGVTVQPWYGNMNHLADQVKQLDEAQKQLGSVEIEAIAGEFIAGRVDGAPPPGTSVTDWLSGIGGSPGILVDPGKARSTPCLRIQLGEGRKPLVYSQGIIGALDEEQQALYCQEGYEDKPLTEKHQERIKAMEQASKLCSVESKNVDDTNQRIETYFSCLGRELKSKGHEAW